jgi:hypothetical protein
MKIFSISTKASYTHRKKSRDDATSMEDAITDTVQYTLVRLRSYVYVTKEPDEFYAWQ